LKRFIVRKNKEKELVLVTGGAGFIGGHLVDALIKDGYRVRVLDNLALPVHNGRLPEWFNKKAEFSKGDVCNKKDWVKALKGVSYVFHLAAYMDFHLDFSAYFSINTTSTALLYEVIKEKSLPVKKIIIASSQAVYGEGRSRCLRHGIIYPHLRTEAQLKKGDWETRCPYDKNILRPLAEKETDLLFPAIPYGISKKTAEEIVFSLGRLYKIPSVALRYSIVLGPRQSFRHFYSGALRTFSILALQNKPLIIHEDGKQLRDYVDIRDVVLALLVVLGDRRADFEAFNVGSGSPVSVFELGRIVTKLAGANFRSTIGLYRVGTPRHSIMDIDKLKKLDWKPRYTLEDSVREYLIWIKNHPEAKKFFEKTIKTMKQGGLLKQSLFKTR